MSQGLCCRVTELGEFWESTRVRNLSAGFMWTSVEKPSNACAFRAAKGIDSFCVEFLGMNAIYKQHHVPFSLGLFHANGTISRGS